ncbi:MAG: AarF/ABC1/UbiB kinase family protein [Rhodobacter sp.]|nr:AarF/ABC1/UbiB kinase family protein [Rhodobacter sp.]
MPDDSYQPRPMAVPASRVSRLARFGGLASGVAGRAALQGLGQIARGARPELRDLLLTPTNARRLAEQLAQMRGAAMKLGQLMSMDTGELLPPEIAEIFARLRAEAHYMPPKQLRQVLTAAWGADWHRRFARFDVRPIAAASIGQVHRALTKDGRDLAIKVQYPGVRRSIDSDLRNVAALIRLAGVVPKELDMGPLLEEAARQLHDEADYVREGRALDRFGALLKGTDGVRVPALHDDLTTPGVLAMDFAPGVAVETLDQAPQDLRDRIARRLLALALRELFELGLMQTDPNFANYRYDPATGDLILLDFGAARAVPETLAAAYRRLLRAGIRGDRDATRAAALEIGVFGPDTADRHQAQLMQMLELAFEPLRAGAVFDFADRRLVTELRDRGMALAAARDFWHIPPADTLFVQRKLAGMYLLAARLGARVPTAPLLAPYL